MPQWEDALFHHWMLHVIEWGHLFMQLPCCLILCVSSRLWSAGFAVQKALLDVFSLHVIFTGISKPRRKPKKPSCLITQCVMVMDMKYVSQMSTYAPERQCWISCKDGRNCRSFTFYSANFLDGGLKSAPLWINESFLKWHYMTSSSLHP